MPRLLNFVEHLSEYSPLVLYSVTYSVTLSRIPVSYGGIRTRPNCYALILTRVSDISFLLGDIGSVFYYFMLIARIPTSNKIFLSSIGWRASKSPYFYHYNALVWQQVQIHGDLRSAETFYGLGM